MGATSSRFTAAFGYLCGPFFGQFKAKHESPPNSDDEEAQLEGDEKEDPYKPKDFKKASILSKVGLAPADAAKRVLKFAKPSDKGMQMQMGMQAHSWLPYTEAIVIEEKEGGMVSKYTFEAVRAKHEKLTDTMLEKLCHQTRLHTIELTHCRITDMPPRLHELENLCVVILSNNHLTHVKKFCAKELLQNKVLKLKELRLDDNRINFIEPDTLADDIVTNMVIFSISQNLLVFLPSDFMVGAFKLRLLDLSSNSLSALPDSILECSSLQILNVTNNQLTKLPDRIERLEDLRKLFASYNKLKSLPEMIGDCSKMQNIRAVRNDISVMPDSILDLWKQQGGMLEELQVWENPLVHPSITAFEMGGLDQAMELFREWITIGRDAEREDVWQSERALEDQQYQQLALEEGEVTSPMPGQGLLALAGSAPPLLRAASGLSAVPPLVSQQSVATIATQQEPAGRTASTQQLPAKSPRRAGARDYYFAHLPDDPAARATIRSAESSLMLLKRNLFIEQQKMMALLQKSEAEAKQKPVPSHIEKYLHKDFNTELYSGRILVTDVDLFFNLLVFATKPLFGTCFMLFDKYEKGGNKDQSGEAYMKLEEWRNLCARVPVKLPEDVQEQIWKLLSWRMEGKLYLTDFIAGWHIHDVEERDPWIARVAKVLRLEYYDMDVDEMRERLRAKGAETATPKLDFDGELGTGAAGEGALVHFPALLEGDVHALAPVQGGGHSAGADQDAWRQNGASGAPLVTAARKLPKVSLDSHSYALREEELRALDEMSEDGAVSDDSLESCKLSQATESSADGFDAEACLLDIEDQWAEEEEAIHRDKVSQSKFHVRSDADLQRLMEMPPEEILWQDDAGNLGRAARRTQPALRPRNRAGRLRNKLNLRDARFKTDVFTVRQAIREAYRNLCFDDFVTLVNFILRGLKLIKHYNPVDRVTYWHCEDPTFKHSIAKHSYAQELLRQMGFVCVNGTYWVWPEKHLNYRDDRGAWGHRCAPKGCPGFEKLRLDDMIALLKLCQRILLKDGKHFNGHLEG